MQKEMTKFRNTLLILFLLSVSINVFRMLSWGRPTSEPTFDDISYLLNGSNLYDMASTQGITASLIDLLVKGYHSPGMTLIAQLGISIFGRELGAIYFIFNLLVALIFLISLLGISPSLNYALITFIIFWVGPFGDFAGNNFRPDVLWIIAICGATAFAARYVQRKVFSDFIFFALLFAISAYFKPSYVLLQFIILITLSVSFIYFEYRLRSRIKFPTKEILIINILMIPYYIFYASKAISYNLSARRSEVWTEAVSVRAYGVLLRNIANLFKYDLGKFFMFIVIALFIVNTIYFTTRLAKEFKTSINIFQMFRDLEKRYLKEIILILNAILIFFVVGISGYGGSFFGFTAFFPWLYIMVLLFFRFIKNFDSRFYKNMFMRVTTIITLFTLILIQALIPVKGWAKGDMSLKIDKPNEKISQTLISICELTSLEKIEANVCGSSGPVVIGASYINGATIDWYLAQSNSEIRTRWIDNLQNAESIKLTIQEEKLNVVIILSNDLPSNDVLPQNYARYELNDYYQKSTNWKNVILDESLSEYVNIYYRNFT